MYIVHFITHDFIICYIKKFSQILDRVTFIAGWGFNPFARNIVNFDISYSVYIPSLGLDLGSLCPAVIFKFSGDVIITVFPFIMHKINRHFVFPL